MSSLTPAEKSKFERVFRMNNGYVLKFSNNELAHFMAEVANVDITDEKYNESSGSKAHRLRAFWRIESDQVVAKTLQEMLKLVPDFWEYRRNIFDETASESDRESLAECSLIIARLGGDAGIEHLDTIQSNADDKDFKLLAKLIKESIEQGQPEAGLDRLHTFLVKYIRFLCTKHNIDFDKTGEPLHSVFAKYIKGLRAKSILKSDMTEQLLKSAIRNLELFNIVRNQQSLAHDNPLLGYDESMFIFKSVSNLVKLVESVEQQDAYLS